MYAIDAATGEARWTLDATGAGFGPAPVIWEDTVLISTVDGVLYAFNKASGEIAWQTSTGRGSKFQSVAIDDGLVFLAYEGYLYAIDVEDGSQIWKIEARIDNDTRMTATERALYFMDRGTLRAVDIATGKDFWQKHIRRTKSGPAVVDGVVYVGTRFFLYALDAVTAQTLWTYETGGFIEGTPLVEGGVAYFGSTDDYVYAVSIASEAPDEPPSPQPTTLLPPFTRLISPKASETASRGGWGLGRVSVAVSADGSTLVVGDPVVQSEGTYGGAAVVFTKQGDTWDAADAGHAVALLATEQPGWEGLEPTDYWDLCESFGQDVAVSADGGIVVVGAPEHRPPGRNEGAVYLFIRPEVEGAAVFGGLKGDAFLLVPPSNRGLFEWLAEVGAPLCPICPQSSVRCCGFHAVRKGEESLRRIGAIVGTAGQGRPQRRSGGKGIEADGLW